MAELGGEHLLLRLGRDEARDVDKCKKHAVDLIVRRAVRKNADEVITVSAQMANGAFGHLFAGTDPAHVLLQVRIIDAADNIGQRPAAVARDQIEQLCNGWSKTANF